MEIILYIAALLAFAMGVVHSVLGEKYILVRLFRRGNLPQLFGGTDFTERTLRFAWHVTTIAWWGFAAILIALAHPPIDTGTLGVIVSGTFLVHFLVAVFGSKGRHLSWIVFLAIGILAFYATRA